MLLNTVHKAGSWCEIRLSILLQVDTYLYFIT